MLLRLLGPQASLLVLVHAVTTLLRTKLEPEHIKEDEELATLPFPDRFRVGEAQLEVRINLQSFIFVESWKCDKD